MGPDSSEARSRRRSPVTTHPPRFCPSWAAPRGVVVRGVCGELQPRSRLAPGAPHVPGPKASGPCSADPPTTPPSAGGPDAEAEAEARGGRAPVPGAGGGAGRSRFLRRRGAARPLGSGPSARPGVRLGAHGVGSPAQPHAPRETPRAPRSWRWTLTVSRLPPPGLSCWPRPEQRAGRPDGWTELRVDPESAAPRLRPPPPRPVTSRARPAPETAPATSASLSAEGSGPHAGSPAPQPGPRFLPVAASCLGSPGARPGARRPPTS